MTVHVDPAGAVTLGDQLREVLAGELADPGVQVGGLRRLTGGASRETWFFEATCAGGEVRPLVLRRDPPGRPRVDGMSTEAHAIASAAGAGVPVPAVLAHGDDVERLGAPFMIMEWLAGETLARRILGEEQYRAMRARLAHECGDILARIHRIEPRTVPGLRAYDPVGDLREQLDLYSEASPVFELGLRWLAANRPDPGPAAVVHGDFRNGNLIVGPEGVRAVLDWELVHVGDPMEDLGWLCVRAWRFGSAQPVGGFGAYAQLFDGYARRSGTPVDGDAVLWWEVLGTLKWGLGCMKMASEHLAGDVRSIERAAIGRRVREQEYDVLLLLEQRLRRLR
jgi:aminoglycoside phosphotransferase (APT) family kinase protein